MRRFAFFLAFAILLTLPAAVEAQVGRLSGKVFDSEGEPIAGAEVSLIDTETNAAVSVETSKKGRFAVAVRDYSRSYDVVIRKDGFSDVRESVRLQPNDPVMGEWTMTPGEASDSIPGLDLTPEEAAAKQAAVDAYNAGVAAYNANDLETAATAFDTAIAEDPELEPAYDIAAVLHVRAQNYDRALELAESILGRRPGDGRALGVRYDALSALGREEAEAALDELVATVKDPETAKRAYNLGLALARDGQFDAAVPRVEQALEINPQLAPAWGLLGDLEIGRGNFERAIEAGDSLTGIEGSRERGLSLRHRAFEAMGDTEGAKAALKELAGENPDAVMNSLFERGQDLFDANEPGQAADIFRQVIDIQPENGPAHYKLGLCLFSAGDNTAARQHLERFLELSPDHPEATAAREMLSYFE